VIEKYESQQKPTETMPRKRKKDSQLETDQPASTKINDRRKGIVAALRRCVRQKGYAETRLSDLAKSSGISVSHLLYYFPSKEAVLDKLCREFLGDFSSEFKRHRDDSPEDQLNILVNQLFLENPERSADQALGLELVALSMHRPVTRRILREHNHRMMTYLAELFSKLPRQEGVTPEEAARIAVGLRFGLFANSIFDDYLDSQSARRIFRRSLFQLAGFDGGPEGS
jgi:AcrR family transcriptional regulator